MLVKSGSKKFLFCVSYLKHLSEKLVLRTFILHLRKESISPASACIPGSSANKTGLRKLPAVAPFIRIYKAFNQEFFCPSIIVFYLGFITTFARKVSVSSSLTEFPLLTPEEEGKRSKFIIATSKGNYTTCVLT